MMHRQKILWEIEKDILQFQETLQTENNNWILEEKILDILLEIEAKVSQIISDKKWRNILQIEEVFQRYLSLHQIESNYTSIDDFLDILISKLSKELRERIIKLDFDLFEKWNSKIEWMWDWKEKIEMKTSQKNKIFLRVLHKIWIEFENIKPFVETLNQKRMRKVPYQIYHIDSWEYKKTVLICDQIGQATFIYDSIIAPEIFQIIEKWEEIEWLKPLKIVYSQKSYESNLKIALDKKLSFEDKVRQIINEDEEKSEQEKTNLTQQQLFEELWNYEWRNEQESYNHFMSFGVKEIKALDIWWKKVTSLKKLSWIEIEWKIYNLSVFHKWIDKVFEWKDIEKLLQTIVQLNEKYQVERDGVVYTAVTNTMKQCDYPDLPDNWLNICKKIKKLTPEERAELGGVWLEGKIWPHPVELYELKKIQENFSKK